MRQSTGVSPRTHSHTTSVVHPAPSVSVFTTVRHLSVHSLLRSVVVSLACLPQITPGLAEFRAERPKQNVLGITGGSFHVSSTNFLELSSMTTSEFDEIFGK